MPKRSLGPCTIVAVDPGSTSGVLVVSFNPRWIKGGGSATWEGLGQAITFKAAYQIGRNPRTFDIDKGRSTKIDRPSALDDVLLPVLAEGQPLTGDGEFDGRGRRDRAFYSILHGERGTVPRADLSTVDAGEVLQVRQISGLLDNFPDAALVIESFTLRPTVSTEREVLSPDRLRLAIETEEMLHGQGRVPFFQSPTDAKNTATNDRLKRACLYFAGMEHATDAGRHAAMFARRVRAEEDLRAQAFPRHFQTWDDD